MPLDKPALTIGRRAGQDLVLPEATVSGNHAVLHWESGTWIVEDVGSTNGSYADHSYERKKQVAVLHGGEVQLGECRLKLVSFAAGQRSASTRSNVLGKVRRADGTVAARAVR